MANPLEVVLDVAASLHLPGGTHHGGLQRTRHVSLRLDSEAEAAIRLLEALPNDQYNFRPDPKGRSIGELAWHLSEIDACLTFGIAEGRFRLEDEPPDLKRPREIKLLAPGYRRIHEQAIARLRDLQVDQLDGVVTFFDGRELTIREVLWDQLLHQSTTVHNS